VYIAKRSKTSLLKYGKKKKMVKKYGNLFIYFKFVISQNAHKNRWMETYCRLSVKPLSHILRKMLNN